MLNGISRAYCVILTAVLVAAGCPAPKSKGPVQEATYTPDAPQFDAAFWSHWGDGKAELAGYDLTYPRYGEMRSGTAITIFVTEVFSNSLRVKADPGKHPDSDVFPAMKLNVAKDFQTGIYDYNTMLSAYIALESLNGRPAGAATKVSYSSQEWCGHVWHQLLFDDRSIRSMLHSYFDGEADVHKELEYPRNGITEDALLLWARGMTGPILIPGETRKVEVLTSLGNSREMHTPLSWNKATLSRARSPESLTVPAGTFQVERWSAEFEKGRLLTIYVEQDPPRRIIRWESSGGETADLLRAGRLEYWKLTGREGEKELSKLGLHRRPPRTM